MEATMEGWKKALRLLGDLFFLALVVGVLLLPLLL
jgi:hypothetical protein